MERKTFIDSFSYIRVAACFAIVLLHCLFASNVYFEDTMLQSEVLWSKMAENLLMWAVPCFLMVTGALLLDPSRKVTLKKLFGKYIRRIVLALVCFTLIFQAIGYKMEGEKDILTGWINDLIYGTSWAHMWYLYLMLGIYLMIPAYRAVIANSKKENITDYIINVLILFTSIGSMAKALGYETAFYIPTEIIYPAYVFLGYRLHKKPLSAWLAALMFAAGTAAISAVTYMGYATDILAVYGDDIIDVLCGYESIFVVMQAAGLYSLMNGIKLPAGGFLRSLDACTFGIYLIHMIGIHALMKWYGFDPYIYGPGAFVLMAAVFFAASYIITFIIRKIPKLDLL